MFDVNGNPEYPVNLLGQLYIKINFTYTGPTITNVRMDEGIAEWGGFNCQWSDLPTFGLLSNLNACEEGVQCPVQPGNQIFQFYIDFNNFQLIINLLKNDTPYQMTFTFKDTDAGNTFVLYAQARCLTEAPTKAPKN
uniref:MD-2-related lipid-recognition domain-containing protein n=1 Tax=Acrobeloides nanus TaxID=290746 RepID=A0A914EBY4_9BILA